MNNFIIVFIKKDKTNNKFFIMVFSFKLLMKYIVEKTRKGVYGKEVKILGPEGFKAISHPIRLKILKLINKEPSYPNLIAKKLGIHEQKIYYHIKKLRKAKLIKIVKEKEIKGALARYYGLSSHAFALEFETKPVKLSGFEKLKDNPKIQSFFKEFLGEQFNGLIVVGNPLPHGPNKTTSRDGHYSAYLSMFLGHFVELSDEFNIRLDTDIINEKRLNENLILIGGPGTNLITAKIFEINEKFSISFKKENYWTSLDINGSTFNDDACGLIAKIKNPFNHEKVIIILAGLRVIGTKACVIGLTKQFNEILNDNTEIPFIRVIKGFDFDSDGKIDGIEVLK